MSGWREITLGQLVSLQRGHDLPSERRQHGAVPIMGSFGVTGTHNVARAKGPGVIVGRSGASAGVVSFTKVDYWPLNTCLFSTNFHGNNPRFVFYFLSTLNLGSYNSGSAQPSLNRNYIAPIPICVPERSEQDSIANFLSSLDDKIELNRRMNETLEAMAQAIFRDWFVDFGPVRRKLAGATDPVEIMGGLMPDPPRAAELAALFPDALEGDAVPMGWRILALSEIAEQSKGTVNPQNSLDTVFEHYSLPAYDSGQHPVRELGENIKSNKVPVPAGAIMLSKLNPETPRVWVPNDKAELNQVASTEFLVFKPKSGCCRELLYFMFRDPNVRQTLEGMVTGTSKSHQRISPPALMQTNLIVGASKVFEAFGELTEPLLLRLLAIRNENRTLAETRDYLLPRLMSGEVRVSDNPSETAA